MSKDFQQELYRIYKNFKERDSFLFTKAADGELLAIENSPLDNLEFQNNDSIPQRRRDELLESLQFKNDNHFLGVICPCCSNYDGRAPRMIEMSRQDFEHLTFANLFVNSNYPIYKETFVNSYKDYDVHLVAHEASRIENLPFKVEQFYPIKRNAWVNNYSLIDEMQSLNLKNKLIILCCGPFGNILGHQLFRHSPQNRIVDAGSSLNEWLQSQGFVRDFLNPNSIYGQRKCVW